MFENTQKLQPESDFRLDTFKATIGSNIQGQSLSFYVPGELFKDGSKYSFSINKSLGLITLTPDLNGNVMTYPSKKAQGRMYVTFGAKHHNYPKSKLRLMEREIVDAAIFTDGRIELPVPQFNAKRKARKMKKPANDSAKTKLKIVRAEKPEEESPATLLKRVNDLIHKGELEIKINDDGLLTYAVTDFILPY